MNQPIKGLAMKKKTFDWVDGSLFLMIACAEYTDAYLDEQEIEVIIQKTEMYVSKLAGEGVAYTHQDVQEKFNKAFHWYTSIGENAPEHKIDQEIIKEVRRVAKSLKKEKWFNADFAVLLISDLIEVADADGELIKNEQHAINMIARLWSVEKPFYD